MVAPVQKIGLLLMFETRGGGGAGGAVVCSGGGCGIGGLAVVVGVINIMSYPHA